jgi:hypothetical protein
MPYTIVRDHDQVKIALGSWYNTLRAIADAQTMKRTIGYQSGSTTDEIVWLPRHHLWTYVKSDWLDTTRKIPRPWCAFGWCVENAPPNSLNITLEINPCITGWNGRGRILEKVDQPNSMLLAHRGGKGGNRRIEREVFLQRITGIDRHGDEYFVLGDVADPNTVVHVANYIHQVT